MKLKLKPAGKKEDNLANDIRTRKEVIEEIVDSIPQPATKEKINKPSAKKVVYISKRGSKAIFDSIGLCAKLFDKDESTIRHRIEHPNAKTKNYDWLKGGRLEYINN